MSAVSHETSPLLSTRDEQNVAESNRKRRRSLLWIGGSVVVILVGLGLVFLVKGSEKKPVFEELKTEAIFGHLEELYAIALKHNNSRSITNGYRASAEYVQSQLQSVAGDFCDVSTQEFKVPIWSELKEPELSSTGIGQGNSFVQYQAMVDFRNFRYGGLGANLKDQQVHVVEGTGCQLKNHRGVKGKLALVQANTACDLWNIAYYSEMSGASGVMIYNDPTRKELMSNRIRIVAWEEGDPLISIPVLSLSNSLGMTLSHNEETVRLNLKTYNSLTIESTINVLCATKDGDEKDTIVVGAHLDSVPGGPGMVDNGSGATSLLEIALVLARDNFKVQNKVVFAWWGAEEIGLLGSRHYVRQIAKDQHKKKQLAMNINFDMLASPNYVPYVHDGKTAPKELVGPSSKIDHLLIEQFDKENEPYKYTRMTAGSDFLPFLLEGIPSGGVLTGAGQRKSEEERILFGGFANAPLDPCYHQSCDTLDNVSKKALGLMSRAAFHAITKVARADNLREWLANKDVQLSS
ncbi:Leucyl aminopeptidase yscIV [Lunasporangiospora selenospora]|uniref:Peptide hydrolase n=1 Tax=Lunasporangiospora selenospora TaxID=979761 RepID=A0A9P6FZH0_9FUNG|nr:Leucyl aminopeptidase yscIV [Lunasporangiospora selenospora]